jgi:hypothetical protein
MNTVNTVNKVLFCAAFIATSSALQAQQYIRLSANSGNSFFELLNKKRSDYDKAYDQRQLLDAVSADAINHVEANYTDAITEITLKEGEAITLNKNIFSASEGYSVDHYPKEYPDGNNTSWRVLYLTSSDYYLQKGNTYIEVQFDDSEKWHSINWYEGGGYFTGLGQDNPTIVGPCKLRLTNRPEIALMVYSSSNVWNDENGVYAIRYIGRISWLIGEKVSFASASGATTKAQSIVLPEGSGDLSVIMEGSNDLINWTREDLGKKPEANRKTFYRIRAVKE